MSGFWAWWKARRERKHRRLVAKLRAKAAAADVQADAAKSFIARAKLPGIWIEQEANYRAIAVEARMMANHYAEEDP